MSIMQADLSMQSFCSSIFGNISGVGIREIIFLPICDATERTILNSLAGANILSIDNRTLVPVKPMGLVTALPSISIEVIVDDTSLRSS